MKTDLATLVLVVSAAIVVAVVDVQALEPACDSVTIGDSTYAVPKVWCDQLVDSTELADPAGLVQLPGEYCHEDYRIFLTRAARDAFVRMAHRATQDSIDLIVRSGYRSARYQREVIARRMAEGKSFEQVVRFVAPPGYSSHETGKAVDIVAGRLKDVTFARSATYRWLRSHAADFDFFETYPNDGTSSLPWEPWHWQYIAPIEARSDNEDSAVARP